MDGISPNFTYVFILARSWKGLLYEENRLFFGPCIDNLGSVVIIRGGGILYYTTGKFTQSLNCTNAKATVKEESKTSPSCSLKSTTKQQNIEFKMKSIVTYATYELISVFCFLFCLHYIITFTPQLSSTLAAGNLILGFQTR